MVLQSNTFVMNLTEATRVNKDEQPVAMVRNLQKHFVTFSLLVLSFALHLFLSEVVQCCYHLLHWVAKTNNVNLMHN